MHLNNFQMGCQANIVDTIKTIVILFLFLSNTGRNDFRTWWRFSFYLTHNLFMVLNFCLWQIFLSSIFFYIPLVCGFWSWNSWSRKFIIFMPLFSSLALTLWFLGGQGGIQKLSNGSETFYMTSGLLSEMF